MSPFKIAAAQVASIRGRLDRNIETHVAAISAATKCGVSVVVFPELSLVGYEPDLAGTSAIKASDPRLDPIEHLSREYLMHVVVGAPLVTEGPKPLLGAICFGPDGSRRTYAKM